MSKSDQLYSELLYLLHRNAYNNLNNIYDGNDSDTNIISARQLIDMVVMLKEKTSGNLSNELEQIQSLMLSELESLYKEKIKKPKINNESTKQ
tara:strand:+ start:278 stop:556 length:279 start_codon:yes stop_codon:yes gene_type:complete